MSKKRIDFVTIANLVCAILSALIVVLQFVPFWQVESGSVSIAGYVWFPTEHSELTAYLGSVMEDYTINRIVLMPILQLVLGFIGAVLCIWKNKNPFILAVPAATGIIGIWGYVTEQAFRLGGNWGLQLLVSCVLAVAAVGSMVCLIVKDRQDV